MSNGKNIKKINSLIKNFKIPGRSSLEECMLITGNKNKFFYKAGIFFCNTTCVKDYQDITEIWVTSFFCLIENTWMGDIFNEMAPSSIQWCKISSKDFSNTYFDLIHNYQPEPFFQERQSYEETHIELERIVFAEAFKVLDTELIKSAIGRTTDDGYVSYFIIDEIVGEQHGWRK